MPRIVAEVFDFGTNSMKQVALANAGPSTELVSVKEAFATVGRAETEAQEPLASLQTKQDSLESNLLTGFNKA